MIRLIDQFPIDDQWYDIEVEIIPCRSPWNHGHRWFAEVSARMSDWPKSNDGGIWYHYYTFDYTTWTLRGSWFKAWKVAAKLHDHLIAAPDERPTWDGQDD